MFLRRPTYASAQQHGQALRVRDLWLEVSSPAQHGQAHADTRDGEKG